MQKGTVCGADRSVYKHDFFPPIEFFALNVFSVFVFIHDLVRTSV